MFMCFAGEEVSSFGSTLLLNKMDSAGNEKSITQNQAEQGTKAPKGYNATDQITLCNITLQREVLNGKHRGNKFLKFSSFTSFSSYSISWRFWDQTKEDSGSVPSKNSSPSKRFHFPFIRKINWDSLWVMCKTWIKNPMNMALFIWFICVAISGAILFLVMTGMLNNALPKKSQRDTWFEVSNQILNALFTLMCLYQHPKRFYHLALLFCWKAKDVAMLRTIYCKNGMQKPNERMHISVVVVLLHLNCFAQYALCTINLGYPRSKRPAVGVGILISIAFGSAAIASLYSILSPLGREYATETDQESPSQITFSPEKRNSFMLEDGRVAETAPQWIGGLFDFWDYVCLAYLSLFCSCCVFGWNMDRLGFGNMYVHTATFLLFCLAPFFIFNLAAVNIDNEAVREALGITGFVLCIFGLLYGGFWRIKMRKRFNLPSNNFCCDKPDITDCFQWLCCCPCSLVQEVRTANYYDANEGKFYLKKNIDDTELVLTPLPREDESMLFKSSNSSPCWKSSSPSIVRME
ncbi:hypothetical protein IEQ34_005801 [Dendrobium chrysotoxum]|uniref:PLAC8 motif-containing protein n=1 Tax=Dendrobium chrysotoxum TaxID=161865 RepID=A0AAV7HDP4_DENCH|nr:hypothetical protein IEQ34_005801 [Dendrobium chrysotoxum]